MFVFKLLRNQFLISLLFAIFIIFTFLDYHISRALVPVFFVLAVFNKPENIFHKLFENSFYFSILLMIFYVFISLLWSENVNLDLGFATMWGTLLLIPVFNEILEDKYKKRLFFLYIPFVFYIGFWIFFVNNGILNVGIEIGKDQVIPGWNYIRVSFFLGILSVILLIYLYKNRDKLNLLTIILFCLVIIFSIICIFSVDSRMGMFSFIVMFSAFCVYVLRKNLIKGLLLLILIISIILGSAYKFSPIFKERINYTAESFFKFKSQKDYSTSGGQRIGIWTIAKDIIIKHPILGAGGGGYRKEFKELYNEKYNYMDKLVYKAGNATLHNELIQVTVQYGIIGLILFLNIFIQFTRNAFKNGNGFMAILFLIYYLTFIMTDIFFERYRTLYLLVTFLPVISFNVLNKKFKH